jgi:hypothetical protein
MTLAVLFLDVNTLLEFVTTIISVLMTLVMKILVVAIMSQEIVMIMMLAQPIVV